MSGAVIGYGSASRAPVYGFAVGLALFILYEGSTAALQTSLRNGADVWLVRWLPTAGWINVWAIKGLAVLALGTLLLWQQRRIPLKPRYFLFLILESVLYSLLLGSTVLFILDHTPLRLQPADSSLVEQLTLSFGAGLYEELLFRVLLFGGMAALFRALEQKPWISFALAALVSSGLFAAAHHVGPLGEPWQWHRFSFRLVSGGLFSGLYLARGFGVTALTHGLYDVWVTLGVI